MPQTLIYIYLYIFATWLNKFSTNVTMNSAVAQVVKVWNIEGLRHQDAKMIENFDSRLLFSSFTNYAVPLFKESNNVTERDHFACLNHV